MGDIYFFANVSRAGRIVRQCMGFTISELFWSNLYGYAYRGSPGIVYFSLRFVTYLERFYVSKLWNDREFCHAAHARVRADRNLLFEIRIAFLRWRKRSMNLAGSLFIGRKFVFFTSRRVIVIVVYCKMNFYINNYSNRRTNTSGNSLTEKNL